ncbi:hypothetical protein Tco_1143228 [Tanacetum coccineum]
MSNTNNNLQTQTSNALHNAIMEAGGKDRPPIIKWAERIIPVAEGSSETTTKGYMENYKNVSQDIRNQLDAEASRESINVQDLETNLYWEFRKFTSRDVESLESYYSRFVTLVKQSQELKTVSYHKLYDILKQHHNEVNEIRAEKLAHTANPLALEYGHVARECQKPKRAKDAAYHKENMLLCKQKEAGIELSAEQVDWRDDTDDEPEDQELEAHYLYMTKIQEVTPDAI